MSKAKAAPPPGSSWILRSRRPQSETIPRRVKSSGRKALPRSCQELKDVVLVEGSAAKLECRVSAFPDPFIVWCKGGKQLKDGPKYRYVFEDPYFVALVVRDGVQADLGGEPPPDVAWLKDGDDIDEDDGVLFDIGDTDTILTIKNAMLPDAGRYEVFAENSLGTGQSFALIDIL
ncbi:hypothetical protein VZT92_005510 [Zoarces viviparus]|uniref:Ig-like domain-containing protein n=1 Tax=Zoarces viviparus TaxID=48416 RepID=A0AAW1FUB1_ZOAVI